MVCKGVCHKYKSTLSLDNFRYVGGQKRCNVCALFVKWDGRHCPCCGMQLRTRPKISRYRRNNTIQINTDLEIHT